MAALSDAAAVGLKGRALAMLQHMEAPAQRLQPFVQSLLEVGRSGAAGRCSHAHTKSKRVTRPPDTSEAAVQLSLQLILNLTSATSNTEFTCPKGSMPSSSQCIALHYIVQNEHILP